MLVLGRYVDQSIIIGSGTIVRVVRYDADSVTLRIRTMPGMYVGGMHAMMPIEENVIEGICLYRHHFRIGLQVMVKYEGMLSYKAGRCSASIGIIAPRDIPVDRVEVRYRLEREAAAPCMAK